MDPIELLADLIRMPSVNPPGEGEGAVAERLREPLDAAGVGTDVVRSPEGRPSLVARIAGPGDRAPLVLLSHTDVVPVEPQAWSRDPFGGEVADGCLWGRGALDMKGVAVMHAAAVSALARSGRQPDREVRLVAVADEERGGGQGARWLLGERPELLGFRDGAPPPEVIGEGGYGVSGLVDRPVVPIVVGEKAPLRLRALASGASGHGSMPPDGQAIQRLSRYVGAVAGPRRARLHPVLAAQLRCLSRAASGPRAAVLALLGGPAGRVLIPWLAPVLRPRLGVLGHLLSDTVTPTSVEAGYAGNVVPGEARARFDCRLLPGTPADRLVADLAARGRRLGVEVEVESHEEAAVSPSSTPLFDELVAASKRLPGRPVATPSLTPATTDLRLVRAAGAVGYGWVPLVLTAELLATVHGVDERVPVEGFRTAVDAMCRLVSGTV